MGPLEQYNPEAARRGIEAARRARRRAGVPAGVLPEPEPVEPELPTPAAGDRGAVRLRRTIHDRPTVFAWPGPSAAELLGGLGPDVLRVYVCGPIPGGNSAGMRSWADSVPAGWSIGEHYRGESNSSPVFRYIAPGGRKVEVHRAASWFGDSASPEQCREAWQFLGHLIRRYFPGRANMPGAPGPLATPGSTGLELWQWSIPAGVEHRPLDPETQELIRSTSGQGRVEVFGQGRPELPQLVTYDMRFAYAARCSGLPAGVPERDRGATFLGYRPARYRCTWFVPRHWDRLGILPMQTGDAPSWATGAGWVYPRQPGHIGTGWVGSRELMLALEHRWTVRIHERIIWPEPAGRGPLDTWSRALVKMRNEGVAGAVAAGDIGDETGDLLRFACRSILLHTIGRFQGSPRVHDGESPDISGVPADAFGVHPTKSGPVKWSVMRPPWRPELAHPEWCAEAWSRTRAAILSSTLRGGDQRGALHVPLASLVGIETDSLHMTADPQWADDGHNGTLRWVATRRGPFPEPVSQVELNRIKAGA